MKVTFEFMKDDPTIPDYDEDGALIIQESHLVFALDNNEKRILEETNLKAERDDVVLSTGGSFPIYGILRKDKDNEIAAVALTENEAFQIFKGEFQRRVFDLHFERWVENNRPGEDPEDLRPENYDELCESFYDALTYNSGNDYYAEAFDEWFEYNFEEDDD